MHQPTFVNLIRDPISWFQSHYTFMRFGMNKGRSEDAPKLGSVSILTKNNFWKKLSESSYFLKL